MLYAEDLEIGVEVPFGTWTFTEDAIIDYASQWDPLPIHIDPVAAKAGPFGQVIASGLHTAAVYQRLMVAAWGHNVVHKAGKTLTINLRRPVLAGMTVTGSTRLLEVTLRPERGDAFLRMFSTLVDTDGNLLLEVTGEGMVLMRPPG